MMSLLACSLLSIVHVQESNKIEDIDTIDAVVIVDSSVEYGDRHIRTEGFNSRVERLVDSGYILVEGEAMTSGANRWYWAYSEKDNAFDHLLSLTELLRQMRSRPEKGSAVTRIVLSDLSESEIRALESTGRKRPGAWKNDSEMFIVPRTNVVIESPSGKRYKASVEPSVLDLPWNKKFDNTKVLERQAVDSSDANVPISVHADNEVRLKLFYRNTLPNATRAKMMLDSLKGFEELRLKIISDYHREFDLVKARLKGEPGLIESANGETDRTLRDLPVDVRNSILNSMRRNPEFRGMSIEEISNVLDECSLSSTTEKLFLVSIDFNKRESWQYEISRIGE